MTSSQCSQIYDTCYMQVYSYALNMAGDHSLADELTQETFYRAFKQHHDFRGEADDAAWLFSIAKHLFINSRQAKIKTITSLLCSCDPCGESEQA